MNSKKVNSLRANTAAQGLPLLIGYGLNLLVTPLVVQRIGLQAFGVWSLTGALAQYAAVFDLGISRSITRFVALHHSSGDRAAERRVIGVAVISIGILGLITSTVAATVGARLIGLFINEVSSQSMRIILVCSCTILFCGLMSRVVSSVSFGRGRMVTMNLALAIQNSAMVLAGGAGVLLDPSLDGFALWSAGGAAGGLAVVIVVSLVVEREFAVSWPHRRDFSEIVRFGIKGQSTLIADLLVFQSTKIIIGIFVGTSAVGAYELGSRVALGARAFGSLSTGALVPRLTSLFAVSGTKSVAAVYVDYARKFAAVSVLPVGASIAASPAFVEAWLGEKHNSVVQTIIFLGTAFTFNVVSGTATGTVLAIGRPGIVARSAIATSILSLAVTIPATFFFHTPGALAGVGIAVFAGAIYGIILAGREIQVPASDYIKAVRGPVTLALALAAAPVCALFLFGPSNRITALIVALTVGVSYVFIYLVLCIKLGYVSVDGRFSRSKRTEVIGDRSTTR